MILNASSGFRAGGAVGGTCFIKPANGGYFGYANPVVDLTSDAISRDPTIVVIDLPKRSHFETLQANWSPGLFETPAGGSFRAKIGFRNKSNCNALTNSDYSKVIGKQAAMYTLILCLILSHSNN